MLDKLYRIRSGFCSLLAFLPMDYCSNSAVMSTLTFLIDRTRRLLPSSTPVGRPTISGSRFFALHNTFRGRALLSLFSLFISTFNFLLRTASQESLDKYSFLIFAGATLVSRGWPFLLTEQRLGTSRQDTSSLVRLVSREISMGCGLLVTFFP
jgi:hypothetical protein